MTLSQVQEHCDATRSGKAPPPQVTSRPTRCDGKENVGLGRAPRPFTVSVASTPAAPQLDSLQDMLAREGYKETRIITPVGGQRRAECPLEDTATWNRDCRESPIAENAERHAPCHSDGAAGPDAVDALLPSGALTEGKYLDIRVWMKGLLDAQQQQQQQQEPPSPDPVGERPRLRARRTAPASPLHESRDKAALRSARRFPQKQGSMWDASLAYRNSTSNLRAAARATAPPAVVPFGPSATPPTEPEPLAFLSKPAAPILSVEDATAQQNVGREKRVPKSVRRTKSADLLQKALQGDRSSRRQRVAIGECSYIRYHEHDCPIRVAWAATDNGPIPPPPPVLTLSTPSGNEPPQELRLIGTEFEPPNVHNSTLEHLLAIPGHPLRLMKRASLAGLNTLFRSSEKLAEEPNPLVRCHPTHRMPAQRNSSRIPRVRSTPALRSVKRKSVPPASPSKCFSVPGASPDKGVPDACGTGPFSAQAPKRRVQGTAARQHKGAAGPGGTSVVSAHTAPLLVRDEFREEASVSPCIPAPAMPPPAGLPTRPAPPGIAPLSMDPVNSCTSAFLSGLHPSDTDPPTTSSDADIDLVLCDNLCESPTVQRALQRSGVHHMASVPILRQAAMATTNTALPPPVHMHDFTTPRNQLADATQTKRDFPTPASHVGTDDSREESATRTTQPQKAPARSSTLRHAASARTLTQLRRKPSSMALGLELGMGAAGGPLLMEPSQRPGAAVPSNGAPGARERDGQRTWYP
ncbi:hypothetical protein MSPP1_001356 [Malassezia sp. CBS 17886]|nr:hypothetical protein MSPP1_001356 [Malassezia sp. CBS 17886]